MLGHAAVNGFKTTKLRWKWICLCITNYHFGCVATSPESGQRGRLESRKNFYVT